MKDRPKFTLSRFIWIITQILLLAFLGCLLLFLFMQGSFIYHPERTSEIRLLAKAEKDQMDPWRDGSGSLIGWQTRDGDGNAPVLIAHGNAGYALHRDDLVKDLRRAGEPGKIFLLEYPGYGCREGKPSEPALVDAAVQAVTELSRNNHPTLLVGESLGTGVLCQIAAKMPEKIRGLILITPFDSLTSVGAAHYPWLPVKWFLTDRYDSQDALKNYPGPVAFLVADKDTITLTRCGLALFETYTGRKKLWLVQNSGHNDITDRLGKSGWHEVVDFVEN